MEQRKPSSPTPTFKALWMLGILAASCCTVISLYYVGLYIIVNQDISLMPMPTLDTNCEDTTCLDACIRSLPVFETSSLIEHRVDLLKQPAGYELARYRLEQDGSLKLVALPTVPDYLKPYQDNVQLHQRTWDYFTKIFPHNPKVQLSYMVVYVDLNRERPPADLDGKWSLYINLMDFDPRLKMVESLTHKYGHMLTLNNSQVRDTAIPFNWYMNRTEFDKMQATCGDFFFTGTQCTTSTAYLNEFGNRFWSGEVYDAWVNLILPNATEEVQKKENIQDYYAKYSDQFVSKLAATAPVEDIAETWTEFILRPKPSGSGIADQKILFFYEYPELVELRRTILRGVCQYASDQK